MSVAVDATSIYIADYAYFDLSGQAARARRILKCPLAGCSSGAETVVQSADISPYALAVDAQRLYYTNVERGTVASGPK